MKKIYSHIAAAFLLSTSFQQIHAQVNTSDSLALVDLYNYTDGPHWRNNTNWLTTKPVSTWYGVNVTNNRVAKLSLFKNTLGDTIPASFGNLSALVFVNFGSNTITGPLPSTIGNLSSLEKMLISFTNISGAIPPEIGNCSQLQQLVLNYSFFTDSIPASIGKLKNLVYLDISNNLYMEGKIPSSIGSLIKLRHLNLFQTGLSGKIPAKIGNLTNLTFLSLGSNGLTGSLPSEIGNLSALKTFDLSFNLLGGSLPVSIGNLSSLEFLYLYANAFSGNIPTEIGNLTNIKEIDFRNNYFSGSIPASIGNCTKLEKLNIYTNQLSGTIPDGIGNMPDLKELILYDNKLSGSLPAAIGNLTQLTSLLVDHNNLTGTIPRLLNSNCLAEVSDNYYTFDAFDPYNQTISAFFYSPQANIPLHKNGNTFSVSAGGILTHNTYKWYKNGVLFQTKTGDSTLTTTQAGSYYVQVKNSVATSLTLTSTTLSSAPAAITFNITPNPASNFINVSILKNDGALSFTGARGTINIYDNEGRKILSQQFTGSRQQVNISKLHRGNYRLVINTDGTTGEKQFMKE